MKLVSIACNHCGAPLDVSEEARFVTCRFCSSKLAIQHSDSAIYTTVAELKATAQELSENLEVLQLQRDLDQLDREWQQTQEGYLVNTRRGPKAPSIDETVFGVGMMMVGVVFMVTAFGSKSWLYLIGGLLIPAGIFAAKGAYDYAKDYQRAKGRYHRERKRLMRELSASR